MQQRSGGLDDAQFGQLLTDIRSTTGVDAAFGGLLRPRRTSFAITHTRGARTAELRDLAIHSGLGLGGKSISLHRPVWVRDYPEAQGITHDYDSAVRAERLRAIFAIPLTVTGDVRAVIYGALRQDVPLGDRTLHAAELAIRRCARDLAAGAESAAPPEEEPSTGPPIRDLRTARDELASLAAAVPDEALKQQLDDICTRMRAPLRERSETPAAQLTPREVAVLAQVAEGCTNREAAERLDILPGTVKAYLESVMRKLGTSNRTATVTRARKSGLLP